MNAGIFDMDGLLLDSERIYQRVWRELAAERGRTLGEDFTLAISGTSGDLTLEVLRRYFPGEDPAAVAAECRRRVFEYPPLDIPLLPGVREILSGMRAAGWGVAVASSSFLPVIQRNLRAHGLDGFFEVWVSGGDVTRGKPSPDIFLLAARRLGAEPENCYVFEDSFNGIRAAKAAGCRGVMIPNLVPPTEEIRALCTHVCPDLSAAWRIIQSE